MITARRKLLVQGMAGLPGVLALAGCRNGPNADASAALDNANIQNAMETLVDTVDTLKKIVAEFGTENPKDVVPHLRTAMDDVNSAVAALREALGYTDQN